MPRLGAALSTGIRLAVQLGALLVRSLLVTGEPNKIHICGLIVAQEVSRYPQGRTRSNNSAEFAHRYWRRIFYAEM